MSKWHFCIVTLIFIWVLVMLALQLSNKLRAGSNEAIGRDKNNQFFKFIGYSETPVNILICIAFVTLKASRGSQNWI